jgi:hypothetical protein
MGECAGVRPEGMLVMGKGGARVKEAVRQEEAERG